MPRPPLATADAEPSPASEPHGRERVVAVLAVGAVVIASLLAAATHIPPERSADGPRLALTGGSVHPVEQRGVLAAGKRPATAGRSVRAQSNPPGQG